MIEGPADLVLWDVGPHSACGGLELSKVMQNQRRKLSFQDHVEIFDDVKAYGIARPSEHRTLLTPAISMETSTPFSLCAGALL